MSNINKELDDKDLHTSKNDYEDQIKLYKKLGALKFQKVVFKVEKWKFKIIKKCFPNYLKYYDKFIDNKIERKIKRIKKKATAREKIEKHHPQFLKSYDKFTVLKEKTSNFYEEKIQNLRKKIKSFNPKILEFYDKYYKNENILKGLSSHEKIEKLKIISKFSKMYTRQELNFEKNRNYHINPNKPTEISMYLEWNKKVHIRNLTKNTIFIPLYLTLILLGQSYFLIFLLNEIIGVAINFECINIQNYNITRLKDKEESLKTIEEIKLEKFIKKYNDASELIYDKISQQDELPSIIEIIESTTNIDQIKQLRDLLESQLATRHLDIQRGRYKI